MGAMQDAVREMVREGLAGAGELLRSLIREASTPGHEQGAMELLVGAWAGLGVDIERISLDDTVVRDPLYSDPVPDLTYEGRWNLRVCRPGSGGARALLMNTHLDVVPPSEGMEAPWGARMEDGRVFGRGACDAKGQAATIWLVYRTLERLGVKRRGDLVTHFVVEEENGGNGTLAMMRRGEDAAECVVLEPTERRLCTSVRGAVWFRLTFQGRAGHSGQAGRTRSALLMARDAIGALEAYHARLLAASRGFPLFDGYANPMPITFGRLEAGNWPASAPSRAVLEGVLGFLPNRTWQQVEAEMTDALASVGRDWPAGSCELKLLYRHDCSVVTPEAALPQALLRCGADAGVPLEPAGMTASCDACYYSNGLGIPTVVYGAGSLGVAHSKEESIALEDIAETAEVLTRWAIAGGEGGAA